MMRGVLYLCATFSAGEAFPSNPPWFTTSSWLTVPLVLFFTSQDELEAKRHDFCRQNVNASSDCCMALIDDIFHPLYEDVKQGTFSKPGGYYLFIKKMNEPKEKYHQVPRKRVQTEETLRKYLGSKEGVADALRQTDQSLTEKEEETEVERVKSEAAEAAKKMLEEMQKKNQQMMQEKEASYQEHMKQLTEKMENERAQLIADQERVLALKLQVFNCSISILPSTVLNQSS
ncbi:guanylate-binding protein 2-like [Muntiacus reevesi]|uniref:guanylate-binding protein 2-like n=1 Tax=Muntiacus reevesi TaxID=9886 RepID=UPI0033074A15